MQLILSDAAQANANTEQRDFVSVLCEAMTHPSVEKIEVDFDDSFDENGELFVAVTDDGMTMHCFVGANGEMTGDWF